MAEATQTASPEPAAQPSSTDSPSLEQVYKQFNVEEEAQKFQPQAQTQQQPQQVTRDVAVPDPVLDADSFKKWAGQQTQGVQQALTEISGRLDAVARERHIAQQEADINNAVQKFRSITGEDVDTDMAEVALGQKVRKDPKFLAVWNNRSKNPQAWNAAVSAYASEFKSKIQFKIDPAIAQSQQAARQSIGSQTKQPVDEVSGDEQHFKGKTGKDFDRAWRNYVDRS